MKEAYCTFEIAELLKKKGFDTFLPFGFNSTWHTQEPRKFIEDDGRGGFYDNKEDWISCPTHQMAMAWLRKIYDLHIIACPIKSDNDTSIKHYCCQVFETFNLLGYEKYTNETLTSYEDAIEAALKYTLENLI